MVLYLINRKIVNAETDFEYRNGGCYLNNWERCSECAFKGMATSFKDLSRMDRR
ncbi:hypothetical protein ACL6C3_14580 [Capilliphycus salinus ALCB114379]|uniref:hypothetical protein n=1 Tax=Capilliphycus salinus TaxID=2768948 RepID=UPI0039A4358F